MVTVPWSNHNRTIEPIIKRRYKSSFYYLLLLFIMVNEPWCDHGMNTVVIIVQPRSNHGILGSGKYHITQLVTKGQR